MKKDEDRAALVSVLWSFAFLIGMFISAFASKAYGITLMAVSTIILILYLSGTTVWSMSASAADATRKIASAERGRQGNERIRFHSNSCRLVPVLMDSPELSVGIGRP